MRGVAGRSPDRFIRELPEDRLTLYRDDLVRTIALIRSTGAVPVIVVHPIRYSSMNDEGASVGMQAMRQFGARPLPAVLFSFDSAGAAVVRSLATTEHVSIVDLPPIMNGRHELFSDPVHYSEAGAAIVAAEVARAIAALPCCGAPR